MARKVTADEMRYMTCCDDGDTQLRDVRFCMWQNLKMKQQGTKLLAELNMAQQILEMRLFGNQLYCGKKNEIHLVGVACVIVNQVTNGWNQYFCDNGDELSCL